MDKKDYDLNWLLLTMEWLADKETYGGITTCNKHNGHGFPSDCAICSRMKELRNEYG